MSPKRLDKGSTTSGSGLNVPFTPLSILADFGMYSGSTALERKDAAANSPKHSTPHADCIQNSEGCALRQQYLL